MLQPLKPHKTYSLASHYERCGRSSEEQPPGCCPLFTLITVYDILGFIPYEKAIDNNRTPSGLSTASLSSAHAMRLSTLLVDSMLKRAQGRSAFFTSINYKQRTFVLDANSLRYYDGDLRIRRNERCRIHLSCVAAVEPADLEKSENYRNAFQVVYFDEFELLRLYVVANSPERQQAWIKAIKREAVKHGAEFLPSYHPGLYLKNQGKWDCCEDINKLSEGCRRIVALPEMKLCGADLNVSNTASMRAKSPVPVKVAMMLKKSQNKSTFFSSNKYQERVFTLDSYALAFSSGYLEDDGKLKGSIPFVEMLIVEPVKDGMLEDKINVFQVVYHEDKSIWNLYIVASSEQERISWVAAIKKECARSGIALQHRYHPGVWLKQERCYNCCRRNHREAQGCAEVMGMSLVSIRDRTNTMDSLAGYRQRLGTLDSVPEHAIAPSPARPSGSAQASSGNNNHLHHGHHQLQIPEAAPSLRPRYLRKADGVPIHQHQENPQATEHVLKENVDSRARKEPSQDSFKPPLPKKKKPELPQREASSTEQKSVSGGQWSKGIADLTIASVGIMSAEEKRAGSSSTLTRGGSNTRPPQTANSSMGNSRQTSSIGLDNSAQYSEDFESVSELVLH
ncbi:hypothetical protein RRG08_037756 [Elysia crispata]|uniref:PH domain-containing protein n=1 Tax=Elysia crispata TaxID=231223 RepID=A0AAE1DTV6_9GAST|nr:hypothetical protein RRG08_037756 [Elysia crispata]